MANLEILQKEARDGFNTFLKKSCGHYAPHLLDSDNNDGEVFRDGLEKLLTHTYTQAIQDAKDAMPKKSIDDDLKYFKGKNDYRAEALTALDALITKEV